MERYTHPSHLLFLAATCFLALLSPQVSVAQGEWQELFDGNSLAGWRANRYPASATVVDGAIRLQSVKDRVHLFYVGPDGGEAKAFTNFELEATVRSEPGSNSGIFFHTDLAVRDSVMHLANGSNSSSTARQLRSVKREACMR